MRVIQMSIFCFMLCGSLFSQSVYNIRDFGAVADTVTVNTIAIQQAIDKCAADGGGRVLVPAGTFVTGSIFLKSGVSLFLDAGAVLKGSAAYADYYWQTKSDKNKGLICAVEQQNIGICGNGVIDGNGGHRNYYSDDPRNGKPNRPNAIYLYRSAHIQLKEFTLKNGARWDVMLQECDFVSVNGIKVLSRVVANNDGVDITDCHYVTVSDSHFDCGDDGICLKSETKRGVKKVAITNCMVKSESNAIKFGTASVGGFEDITISNCVLYDTRLSGLALELVDGGVLNRVTINNITMHRVNGSIFLKLGKREGATPGIFKNVFISNIIADGIGEWQADTTAAYYKAAFDPRIGMTIAGQPGYEIENVVLDNIYLRFAGGGTKEDAARIMRDKPDTYPEYTNFGITPAYGINCRFVKGLSMRNIQIDCTTADARPAVYFENVVNTDLSGIRAAADRQAPAYIRCLNVQDLLVQACKPNSADIPFLFFDGACRHISVMNNDVSSLTKTYAGKEEAVKALFLSGNRNHKD